MGGRFTMRPRRSLRLGTSFRAGIRLTLAVRKGPWIYFSAGVARGCLGEELSRGDGRERIYVIKPTGPFMDDPNVTDKKFPGNPTRSYRPKDPLRVVSEHLDWVGYTPEEIQTMKDFIADKEPIDD